MDEQNNTVMQPSPATVRKTAKAYLAGAFVRSESGRTYTVSTPAAQVAVVDMSRKDARDAVRAAVDAAHSWWSASAYLRGQICYRMAEMLTTADQLTALAGALGRPADDTAAAAADIAVHYAGWTDKLPLVLGSVNPVPGHVSASAPQGGTVTVSWLDEAATLAEIVEDALAALAAGNAVIQVLPGAAGLLASALAEVVAVSDVPKGVWQVLPSTTADTMRTLAGATAVRSLDVRRHPQRAELERLAAASVTKCRTDRKVPGLQAYASLANCAWQMELRTTVAPAGR